MLRKCSEFVAKFGTFNDPQDLEDQLQTVLKSDASGILSFNVTDFVAEEVQEMLLGILGFDDMDFIQDLFIHRDAIVHSLVHLSIFRLIEDISRCSDS